MSSSQHQQHLPLAGKTAIITGASRGIGAAIAHKFATLGIAKLVLTYTSSSSAEAIEDLSQHLRSEFQPRLKNVAVIKADMGTLEGPLKVITEARHLLGEGEALTVNILVNNAGVAGNWRLDEGPKIKEFEWMYNVNVRGPLLLVHYVLPYLAQDRCSRIINVSSVSSTLGLEAQSIYGGTKAALEAMTRTWARELKDYGTVNSVNPGPVETDMYAGTSPEFQYLMRPFLMNTPGAQSIRNLPTGGRAATPEEIAGIVAMLCGPDSGWCTGSVVCANGGMVMGLS